MHDFGDLLVAYMPPSIIGVLSSVSWYCTEICLALSASRKQGRPPSAAICPGRRPKTEARFSTFGDDGWFSEAPSMAASGLWPACMGMSGTSKTGMPMPPLSSTLGELSTSW